MKMSPLCGSWLADTQHQETSMSIEECTDLSQPRLRRQRSPLPPAKISAGLTIQVGSTRRDIVLSTLTKLNQVRLFDDFRDACTHDEPIVISLSNLLEWPEEAQQVWWWLLGQPEFESIPTELRAGNQGYEEPLDLALGLWDECASGETKDQWITCIAIVVALYYDLSQHDECTQRIKERLEFAGLDEDSMSQIKQRVATFASADVSAEKTVRPNRGKGGNALLMAEDYLAAEITYAQQVGGHTSSANVIIYFGEQFYWFRGGRWLPIAVGELRASVAAYLQNESACENITGSVISNVIENLKGLCVVACAHEHLPMYVEESGRRPKILRPHLLALRNGLLDLDELSSGKPPVLLPPDPRWFSPVVLPYSYDPTAGCPQFLAFLYQVLDRDENGKPLVDGDKRVELLQEWFAYTLLSDGRFQKLLLMVGDGSNGKGVIQILWTAMLGAENVSHQSLSQFSGAFSLEPMVGKMANICGDLNDTDNVAEGTLKELTGEDEVSVNRKNKSYVKVSGVKMVFACNTLPRFLDKSRGIWRRLMIMPFQRSFSGTEVDPQLPAKLKTEGPGIFNWAIAGLPRLIQQGGFTQCKVCDEAVRQHHWDCDPIAQFLDEGEYGRSQDCQIIVDELYRQYDQWCDVNGYRPLSKSKFNKQIAKLPSVQKSRSGTGDHTGKRPYRWMGIGPCVSVTPVDADDF